MSQRATSMISLSRLLGIIEKVRPANAGPLLVVEGEPYQHEQAGVLSHANEVPSALNGGLVR